MGVGRDVAKYDFTKTDKGEADYDAEADHFLSRNIVDVIATNAMRAFDFGNLIDAGVMTVVSDHLEPAEEWSTEAVIAYIKGTRSAYSRFKRDDRFVRDVHSGLIDELRRTGQLRRQLLPPRYFSTGEAP